ncbi:MAG: tRNA (adenine-N1)-methyltransferase [Candidatus Njordarchaeota archaeon]
MSENFKFFEYVLLFHPKKKKKLCAKIMPEKPIHTQWGVIKPEDIVSKKPGDSINTHLGERLIIFRPLLYEKIEYSRAFKYSTQIVRPRDWGLILSFSNIRPGSKVIEIGTGSGAFTAFLCEIVQPDGHVYSYEIRPERAEIARQNLVELGVPDVYDIKIRDVARDGIDEKNVDAIFVDIPEPWTVISFVYDALKPSGILICYVPTFNQIAKLLPTLDDIGFADIRIFDHFFREIQTNPNAVRPLLKSYVFSAFIVLARKISK